MLIDDITVKIKAGGGGRGAVAWNKNFMSRGPVGGSGGDGGSVFIEGIADLSALNQFRFKKEISADNGENGKGQFCDGATAKDKIIKVPVGTIVRNLVTNETFELVKIGQKILVAKGGKGGRGNFLFRSSTNTSPTQFEEGSPGEEFTFHLELKLIADIGVIGFPNAGKSSLINELTRAKSKVANYPFTTLEPHLGVYYELILADIPGLIEGASQGKGLGTKFLRHIERTKTLFHLVAADSENPTEQYKAIRNELGAYNKDLLEKDEYVFLSKSDLVPPEDLREKLAALKKLNPKTVAISVYDWDSLAQVKNILNKLIKDKKEKEPQVK